MMILISGQPGNGKTLRAMALMLEEYERNQAAVKEGKEQPRRFFTNITGATRLDNPNAFEWVEPIPFAESPDSLPQRRRPDWRLCPDGAYVLYDEAHADGNTEGLEEYGVLFPGTGKPGESDDPRIRSMSTHRKRGIDLVFMTQWPSKIHHNVRTLLGKHIHMNRAMGLQRAGVLTWTRVQVDPYDETQRDKAEEEIWTFPTDLYSRFLSATIHTATYKFKVPKRIWGALSSMVAMLVVCWAIWGFVFAPDEAQAEPSKGEAAQAKASLLAGGPPVAAAGAGVGAAADYIERMTPAIPMMPWTAPAFADRQVQSEPRVFCSLAGAGVDANGQHQVASCHCLTEQGTRYRMPRHQCEYLAENGEAYNPYRAPERDRGRGGSRGTVEHRDGGSAPMQAASSASGSPGAVQQQASYGAFRG